MSAKMVCYYTSIRRDKRLSAQFVLAWLEHFNSHWDHQNFTYFPERNELILRGKGLGDLGFEEWFGPLNKSIIYCILESLSLDSLDLSETDFSQISLLRRLSLKKLDISKTRVKKLSSIKDFKELRQLTLSSKHFSLEELKEIPSHIEVIFVD